MNQSNNSFWKLDVKLPKLTSLEEDKSTDVCIVGAGIAGLTSAYLLLKAGKKVIVLDKSTIGSGETGNTSAHLSNALDDRYAELISVHGLEKARLAAESHTVAIDKIEEICQTEKIVCDFLRVEGVLFPKDKKDESVIQKEYEAAKQCGVAIFLKDDEQFGKCLIFKNQAQFNPLEYLVGLAKCIIEMGGEIFDKTFVKKIVEKPLHILTERNKKVSAKKIITCVDGQMNVPLKMHFKLDPQRSYVIGAKIPVDSIETKLYWDTADPYHYVRIQNLNKTHDLLIVGGEDHRVGNVPKHNPYKSLLTWARQQFTNNKLEIDYQWSGQIIEPIDYLAYIGYNPNNKNILLVTGDSGHGLTHGTIAGILFTDLITGKTNSWESLYKVDRLLPKSIKNLLGNAVASAPGYLKYLLPISSEMPKRGEGKIVQQGIKKIAVYKDDEGNIKQCSAYCAHLGAVLSWNKLEKSWDCPAHGSRFDVDGNPLNPPTMSPLPCKLNNKSE